MDHHHTPVAWPGGEIPILVTCLQSTCQAHDNTRKGFCHNVNRRSTTEVRCVVAGQMKTWHGRGTPPVTAPRNDPRRTKPRRRHTSALTLLAAPSPLTREDPTPLAPALAFLYPCGSHTLDVSGGHGSQVTAHTLDLSGNLENSGGYAHPRLVGKTLRPGSGAHARSVRKPSRTQVDACHRELRARPALRTDGETVRPGGAWLWCESDAGA